MSKFIEEIKYRAKKDIKTIVLPEAEDVRILKAAQETMDEAFANIILVGNKEKILEVANQNNIKIEKASIVEPLKSEDY